MVGVGLVIQKASSSSSLGLSGIRWGEWMYSAFSSFNTMTRDVTINREPVENRFKHVMIQIEMLNESWFSLG